MTTKQVLRSILVVAVLAASLASTSTASAWSGCTGTVTVQWGDTLGSIAAQCGISVSALLAANPQIWNASLIYPGQVISLTGSPYYASNYYPPNQYPSNYYPANQYPPNYYPPNPYPAYAYPVNPPPSTSQAYSPFPYPDYGNLKITSGKGLRVRTGPGVNYNEIRTPLVSTVKNTHWQYRKSSLTTDFMGFVWVEIALGPNASGYSTGWILTRDSLGGYFTEPPLGSLIEPDDPEDSPD